MGGAPARPPALMPCSLIRAGIRCKCSEAPSGPQHHRQVRSQLLPCSLQKQEAALRQSQTLCCPSGAQRRLLLASCSRGAARHSSTLCLSLAAPTCLLAAWRSVTWCSSTHPPHDITPSCSSIAVAQCTCSILARRMAPSLMASACRRASHRSGATVCPVSSERPHEHMSSGAHPTAPASRRRSRPHRQPQRPQLRRA